MRRIKELGSRIIQIFQESLMANASYLLGVLLTGSVAGVAFWAISARLYTLEEVGIASAVLSIIQLLSEITSIGIGMGMIRFLPKEVHPRDMFNTAATFVLVTAILGGGVYLVGIEHWSPNLSILRAQYSYAIVFVAFLAGTSLNSLFQSSYQAFRHSRYAFLQVIVNNILRLTLVITLVSIGLGGLFGAMIAGTIAALVFGFFVFLPRLIDDYKMRPKIVLNNIKKLVPYSGGSYIANLFYRIPILIAPPLVLERIGAEASAHAYIGWMLGMMISSPGQAIAGSAFAEGANARDGLRQILSRAGWISIAITTGISVVVWIAVPWFLALFGESYIGGAVGLVRWMAVASPFVSLNTLYFSALRVQDKLGELIMLSMVSMVISLLISLIFINKHGLAVTGMGWLLGQIAVTLIASRQFYHYLKQMEIFSKVRGIGNAL